MFNTYYVHDDGFIAKCDTPIPFMFCCWAWMGQTTQKLVREGGYANATEAIVIHVYVLSLIFISYAHTISCTPYICCHCMHVMHACTNTCTHIHRGHSSVPELYYPVTNQIMYGSHIPHMYAMFISHHDHASYHIPHICHVHITSRS